MRFAFSGRTAAGLPAAVLLSGVIALAPLSSVEADSRGAAATTDAAGRPDSAPTCRISPAVLDVSRPAGPLIIRIELPPSPGETAAQASPAESIEPGVYISSVDGVRLPAPSQAVEGIGERVAGRSVEGRADASRRTEHSNGIPELVVRFDRPADGDPTTREDGDAGDLLAMLMGVPDGQTAEVCAAGRAAGASFECCDTVVVRNRGLRDLPRGLIPTSSR